MPRKSDPGKLKVGPGLAASDSIEHNAFLPNGTRAIGGNALTALEHHLEDETNAHAASAIQIDDVPPLYVSRNVEGALDEIAALMPPKADAVGVDKEHIPNHGLPDWGILKIDDASIVERDVSVDSLWETTSSTLGANVFPYYHKAPRPLGKEPFGNDNADTVFNFAHVNYFGGGPGLAHAGAYVYSDPKNGQSLQMTKVLLPSLTEDKVVVSGIVSPADRGVLALIRFNHFGLLDTINVPEDVLKRCPAAILLGQGIGDGPDCDSIDGQVGGIFSIGEPEGRSWDPYVYPGRATGQYDLKELHTGVNFHNGYVPIQIVAGNPASVTHNLNYTFVAGQKVYLYCLTCTPPLNPDLYTIDQVISPTEFTLLNQVVTVGSVNALMRNNISNYEWDDSAGQVRLGTDAAAGITPFGDGIPILGGGEYSRGNGQPQELNFFRYRMPYLDSYAEADLHYLHDVLGGFEYKSRYLKEADPNAGVDLPKAGNYEGYKKEYYVHQLARYRHQFDLDISETIRADLYGYGTYALVHFKTEAAFEKTVRDGYQILKEDVYSAWFVEPNQIRDTENLLELSGTGLEKEAKSYYMHKNVIVKDDRSDLSFGVVTNASEWTVLVPDRVIEISGVKYFVSLDWITGNPAVQIKNPNISLEGVSTNSQASMFHGGFRTHGEPASIMTTMDEHDRMLTNTWPAYMYMGTFVTSTLDGLSPINGFSADTNQFIGERVELNWMNLCTASLSYPIPAFDDQAEINWEAIEFEGESLPKFTTSGRIRFYYRRPGKHARNDTNQDQEVELKIFYTPATGPAYEAPILFHGAKYVKASELPRYGNFMDGLVPYSSLYSPTKDSQERFLDEAYRVQTDFLAAPQSIWTEIVLDQLNGPGLPHGTQPLVDIDVRPNGVYAGSEAVGFLYNGQQQLDLNGETYLQVAGLPQMLADRKKGVTTVAPANGVLLYPQNDYNFHAPTPQDMPSFSAQPDYTTCGGTRDYVRGFVVKDGEVGDTKILLHLKGLSLSDIAYEPITPDIGNRNIGVAIKVPGLTTWMDVGRRDGDGPSKQDAFQDGAGCQIIGTDTFDYFDEETNLPACQIHLHIGPVAHLFAASNGKKNVYVKVVMYETPVAKALNMGAVSDAPETRKGLHQIDIEKGLV